MKPSILLVIALLSVPLILAAQQNSTGRSSNGLAGQQPLSGIAQDGSKGSVTGGVVQTAPYSSTTTRFASPNIGIWMQQAANCPVALNASHLADGSMIRAAGRSGSVHPNGIGQWLHITVMTPTVSTAQLLVRGFSDKPRMTQSAGKNDPDAERTVTISFGDRPNGEAIGNVWAPGLTAVTSIDLISLTYVDGSTWNAPGGHTCSVTPDPLMLISGR